MTIYRVWVSTDGHYYALPYRQIDGTPYYDVLDAHGPGVWLSHRYQPTGFDDTDPRYTHAEFPQMIASWTNKSRWTRRTRRHIPAFRMTFMDVRQDLQLLPFSKRVCDPSPYLAHYEATFLKQTRISRQLYATLQARIAEAETRTVAPHDAMDAQRKEDV